jgi:hypothetical protein
LRFGIDTPLSLTHLLHFDALLGRLSCDRGGSPADLPLACTQGVWHASAALIETGPFGSSTTSISRVKSLHAEHVPPGLLNAQSAAKQTIGEMSPYRPSLTPYPVIRAATAVWFSLTGDRSAVLDMASHVRSLGAMSTVGYGRVTSLDVIDLPTTPTTALVLADGLPARAIPLTVWDSLCLPRHPLAVVSVQRWTPPYWTGDTVACISPTQQHLTGTHTDILSLLGARSPFSPAVL